MRISVAQTPGVRLEEWRETLTLIDELIDEASGLGADLVLLPECVWPAYCLGSKEAYVQARSEGLPQPAAFVERMRKAADEHRLAICAGFVDEDGDRLFNAACLIGTDGGLIGVRYKCFLWGFDRRYFSAGERIEPLDTEFGRVGLLICADARLPEIPATLATRGAEVCLQPTAWVDIGGAARPTNPQPEFLIAARAAEFGVPFASASKWGVEENTLFVGQSLICDADGNILVQCGQRETGVIAADVRPHPPRQPRVHDAERGALLADGAHVLPADDVPALELLLLPLGESPPDRTPGADQTGSTSDGSCRLFLQPGSARESAGPPLRQSPGALVLMGPGPADADLGGIRIAALSALDMHRFAAARVRALQGSHVLVAFGDEASLTQVRARACENRVYVVWCRAAGVTVIDPRGDLLSEKPWPPRGSRPSNAGRLDTRAAAHKEFAHATNLLADRRPRHYAF